MPYDRSERDWVGGIGQRSAGILSRDWPVIALSMSLWCVGVLLSWITAALGEWTECPYSHLGRSKET
jgi:hypothetical protein